MKTSKMVNESCATPCSSGPALNCIQRQINNAIEQGRRILEGGLGWSTFTRHCENLKAIMVEFFNLSETPDQRMLKLQEETKSVIAVTKKMQDELNVSRSVEKFIMTCEEINKHLEQHLNDEKQPDSLGNRLRNLNEHITDVGKITESLRHHGVVTADANEFVRSCKKINTKLDKCVNRFQNSDKKANVSYDKDQNRLIEFLKRQLSGVEIMTQDMTNEGVASKSLENFLSACHDFRMKLDGKDISKNVHENTQVDKLIKQLNEAIQLSKVAKKSGFASKNVDNFINYCQKTKARLEEYLSDPSSSNVLSSSQADMINDFENNIDTILDIITEMKTKGQFSQSLQDFVTTCQQLKQALKVEENVRKIPVLDMDKYMDDATCSQSCNCKVLRRPKPKDISSKISSYTSGYYNPPDPITTVTSTDPICGTCEDDRLGLHETRVKKIITLKRFRDEAGVMNEQTDTVVLRESSYDPNITTMPEDVDENDKTIKSIEIETYSNLPVDPSNNSGVYHLDTDRTVGYVMADPVNEFIEARKVKSMFIYRATCSREPSERRCISYLNLSKCENTSLRSLTIFSAESKLCNAVSLDNQQSST